MRSQLAQLETDITGLKAKIAERERNDAASGTETFSGADGGVKRWHGESFRHTEPFVKAHRAQLAALEYQYVLLKMHGEGWSAAEIIERMSAPAAPEPTQRLVVSRTDDPIRSKLRELLAAPGFYLSRSRLEELLS